MESSPGKPRFKQNIEQENKLFMSEIKGFQYEGKTIESGTVSIEAQNCSTNKLHQLVLRNVIGKTLFSGYIKKK